MSGSSGADVWSASLRAAGLAAVTQPAPLSTQLRKWLTEAKPLRRVAGALAEGDTWVEWRDVVRVGCVLQAGRNGEWLLLRGAGEAMQKLLLAETPPPCDDLRAALLLARVLRDLGREGLAEVERRLQRKERGEAAPADEERGPSPAVAKAMEELPLPGEPAALALLRKSAGAAGAAGTSLFRAEPLPAPVMAHTLADTPVEATRAGPPDEPTDVAALFRAAPQADDEDEPKATQGSWSRPLDWRASLRGCARDPLEKRRRVDALLGPLAVGASTEAADGLLAEDPGEVRPQAAWEATRAAVLGAMRAVLLGEEDEALLKLWVVAVGATAAARGAGGYREAEALLRLRRLEDAKDGGDGTGEKKRPEARHAKLLELCEQVRTGAEKKKKRAAEAKNDEVPPKKKNKWSASGQQQQQHVHRRY